MDLHLSGKVALITGGAGGIGEAISRTLAAEGATVVIADIDDDKAAALVSELNDQHHHADSAHLFIHCDVTSEVDVTHCLKHVAKRRGRLDILVNNAAANDGVALATGPAQFRASIERNLTAVYTVTHHASPLLRKTRGAIVNIGSKVASTGQGGTSGYAASKGGINALTREWAIDFLPDAVRVNAVIPAEVWTPMYERWLDRYADDPTAARRKIEQRVPLSRRMTTTQEIADAVAFLASSRASHITGQLLYVDGGYTHLDRALTSDA